MNLRTHAGRPIRTRIAGVGADRASAYRSTDASPTRAPSVEVRDTPVVTVCSARARTSDARRSHAHVQRFRPTPSNSGVKPSAQRPFAQSRSRRARPKTKLARDRRAPPVRGHLAGLPDRGLPGPLVTHAHRLSGHTPAPRCPRLPSPPTHVRRPIDVNRSRDRWPDCDRPSRPFADSISTAAV